MNLPATEQEAGLARMMAAFFEPLFYTSRYPDVAGAGLDPLIHFIRFGIQENRDPNRFFDNAWYLEHYPDVHASLTHPLLHYLTSGAAELRNPHPRFDAAWYADEYPEAAANPLLYHIRIGAARGYLTEKPLIVSDYLPSVRPAFAVPAGVSASIIVPVYKGLEETRRCLESVFVSNDSMRAEIIVINDHTPDAKLRAWLDTLAGSGQIRLLRNPRNQGFVRSVNAGMAAAGDHDVVLLNSDTDVPAGWLDRLAAQAYAAPRIATVSPLSNNATICGYPADQGAPVALGRTAAEIDALCQTVNAGRSVPAPTTVGFCMYIRREALTETGDFDAERFSLGYGEENDFCLRAAAQGWRHHIACDTFVYHRGSVSFGARTRALTKQAGDLIAQRFPGYARDVAVHIRLDAIGPYRWTLTGAVLKSTGLPLLLMVSHGMGGGVRRHIDTLTAGLAGKANVLLLESSTRGASLSVPALPGHPVLNLPSERLDDLVKILRHCGVGRVHLHHLLGMDLDVRALIHRLGVPFDLTVHDYLALCPQVNFQPGLTELYCNEPEVGACNACIAARPSHSSRDILSWRAERAWQFHSAERVFCPSHDVLSRLERYGLAGNAVLAPHEPVAAAPWPVAAVSPGAGKLRIAILGVLADHKGARTVAAVAEASGAEPIEIHLIGHTENNFPGPARKRMKITGPYQEAALAELIDKVAPHVIWLPAAWPETFSYTLSAAIASGRPIAATQIGAIPERLHGRPFTWLVNHRTSPAEWIALFRTIRAALPAQLITETTVLRKAVPDAYAPDGYIKDYLRSRPARRRPSRPVIAVVPERYDGGPPTPCAYIRLLQPLDHPAIGGDFEVRLADARSVLDIEADIIATQRYALPDAKAVDALAGHARRTGAKLLYDLDDDLLNIPRNHPEADELRPKAPGVSRILAAADAVWVSTPNLADRIACRAANISIVPNGLDERIWAAAPPNNPAPAGPARLFCMGTTTHERDLAMILPALLRLKQEFGRDVEIHLVGMTGAADLPAGIHRLTVPHHAMLSYPGFVHWLTTALPGWHIGLAPLLDTPFNRSKSSIKVMDYAALGLGVVASDVPVFRGSIASGPAGRLVANDARAWYAALSWLIRNRAERLAMSVAARPAFLATSSLAVQAEARREAWLRLLAKPRRQTAPVSREIEAVTV